MQCISEFYIQKVKFIDYLDFCLLGNTQLKFFKCEF